MMRLLLNAKNLTQPTIETIRDYSSRRISKIAKFIKRTNFDYKLAEIRINTEFNQSSRTFTVKAVLTIGGRIFVINIVDEDIRKAIDFAIDNLREQLNETRGKLWLNDHN